MSGYRWVLSVLAVGSLLLQGPGLSAQQSRSDDEITQLAADVYLYRHQFHQAIFITTPKGVIVTDPISSDAATWLQAKIKTLTDQPVRYVIYSHHHDDHITGGSVFAEQATFVSHAAAREKILQAADPNTPVPDLTFTDRMSIDLGGKHVELIYTGKNHSDNSLVVLLPQNKLLFAVDFIPVETVAYRTMRSDYPDDWIESLKQVEQLDFETSSPAMARSARRSTCGNFAAISKLSERPWRSKSGKARVWKRRKRPFSFPSTSSGNGTRTGSRRMWRGCTGTSPSGRTSAERRLRSGLGGTTI